MIEQIVIFKAGFLIGRLTDYSIPTTMDETYQMLESLQIKVSRGEDLKSVERKIDTVIKNHAYDQAMRGL